MLDPQQHRRQLFDALRPPDGYQLDRAIGTTFSLDLLALMSVPLAFTFWGGENAQGTLIQDPLALLHSVRQMADRIFIFCQAGQIGVPRADQRLFTYLENTVFEVTARSKGGVFHPKIWALRYVPITGNDADQLRPKQYRFLCLSRNLTFDQSWDTILVMDGELSNRSNAFSRNHPLGDFIKALPGLVVEGREVSVAAEEAVDLLQEEIRRVDFHSPWGNAVRYEFLPLGVTGRRSWPFRKWARRQLVISPFVAPDFLLRLSDQSSNNTLVSRLNSLATLPDSALDRYRKVFFMDPDANPELEEEVESEGTGERLIPLSGLHAKLFISEFGRSDVELFTGSANATNAAFSKNVEFLVKFMGKGRLLGIDKLLVEDNKGDREIRFLDLLRLYRPEEWEAESDPVRELLEQAATSWQRQLAASPWRARVEFVGKPGQSLDSNSEVANINEALFDVNLRLTENVTLEMPVHLKTRCWLITRRPEDAVNIQELKNPVATLHGVSYVALTSFFAFAVTASEGDQKFTKRFVLNIPLENAPSNRRERALLSLLDDREKVLKYMLFLLTESDRSFAELSRLFRVSERKAGAGRTLFDSVDLLESMVTALYRNPTRLDQIAGVVADLEKTGHADLVPEGFREIWPPIWEARQHLEHRQIREDGGNVNERTAS